MHPAVGHPDTFNAVVSTGITLVALVLAVLTLLAYARERERHLAVVSIAYGLFVLRGVFSVGEEYVEHVLGEGHAVGPELLDHLSGLAVLVALVLFFLAIVRSPRR